MRNYLILFLAALSIATIWWLSSASDKDTSQDPEKTQTQEVTPTTPRPAPSPKKITLMPIAASTSVLHGDNQSPEDDLSLIHSLLRFHRKALGSNPIGLNDEITAALTGRNAKGAATLPTDHPAISKDGELLDRWGTPYRFHAYSKKLMEVQSAGPDRKFFTEDDLKLLE